mmetsp:Transcript_3149/g.3483  ORF Transcript_3149/g.3483 Transcript_3149/m.3483 type:complete len:208 (-) Transcript_3149:169-792(-)
MDCSSSTCSCSDSSSSSSSSALATNTGTDIEAGISATSSSPTKIPSEETPFVIGLISDHISKSIKSKNSNSNKNIDTLNKLGNTNETQTKTQTKMYLLSSFCRNNGAFIVVTLVLLVLWCWPSKMDDETEVSMMKRGVEVEIELVDKLEAVLDNSNIIDNNSNSNSICVCYNCKGSAGCCKCTEQTCPLGGSINRFDSSCRGRFVLF